MARWMFSSSIFHPSPPPPPPSSDPNHGRHRDATRSSGSDASETARCSSESIRCSTAIPPVSCIPNPDFSSRSGRASKTSIRGTRASLPPPSSSPTPPEMRGERRAWARDRPATPAPIMATLSTGAARARAASAEEDASAALLLVPTMTFPVGEKPRDGLASSDARRRARSGAIAIVVSMRWAYWSYLRLFFGVCGSQYYKRWAALAAHVGPQ